jgi:hypothetical protein
MILRKQINNFVRCVNGCECDKRQPLFLPPKPFKVQQIAQNVKEDTLGFQYMCLSQNRFSEGGGEPFNNIRTSSWKKKSGNNRDC